MAIRLFDAIGFISIDDKKSRRKMAQIRKDSFSLAKGISSTMLKIGKVVTVGLAGGLAATGAFVTASLVKFAQLETGVSEILTLFGDVGPEADKMRRNVTGVLDDLVTQFGQKTPAAIKGTYDAISAGIKEADIGEFMKDAARLAVAGVTDISQSVDLLTSVMNAYGLSADKAEEVSDKLFTTVRLGKTTITDLASALGQVAPVASAAGVSLDEVTGALAVLTGQGLSTSEAVTGLKAAIQALLKPAAEAQQLANELGLDFGAGALEGKGFADVLRDVERATGGDIEKIAKLFGSVRALNAVLALTSDSGAVKFVEALSALQNSTGATDQAFQTMENTLGFKLNRILGGITSLFQTLGSAISGTTEEADQDLPTIGSALDGIGDFLERIRDLISDSRLEILNLTQETLRLFNEVFLKIGEPVVALFERELPGGIGSAADVIRDLTDLIIGVGGEFGKARKESEREIAGIEAKYGSFILSTEGFSGSALENIEKHNRSLNESMRKEIELIERGLVGTLKALSAQGLIEGEESNDARKRQIVAFLDDLVILIKEKSEPFLDLGKDLGKEIGQGIIDGMILSVEKIGSEFVRALAEEFNDPFSREGIIGRLFNRGGGIFGPTVFPLSSGAHDVETILQNRDPLVTGSRGSIINRNITIDKIEIPITSPDPTQAGNAVKDVLDAMRTGQFTRGAQMVRL